MDDLVRHQPGPDPSASQMMIFDVLPDAYLITNERYEVVTANSRYLSVIGTSLPQLIGKSVYDINQHVPDEQRETRRAWLESVLPSLRLGETRSSPILRYDLPLAEDAAAGQLPERYWQARVSRVSSGSGLPGTDLLVFCLTDVTESVDASERHKRERAKLRSQARLRQILIDEANAELRSQQARLQEVLTFARVGAWEWDLASGQMSCTEQCYRNMGIPLGEPLNAQRLFTSLIEPEDRARVHAAVEHSISSHDYFEVEYRVLWPDGSVRWLLARGAPHGPAQGAPTSLVGFTLDITERKQAELHHQAVAREEKQARERSESEARAMDHFITAVSHELRSPLHAIVSWTMLMQRTPDPSYVARAVQVIERNTRQLSLMVDDLLDSGAIATGKLSITPRPVDIGALAGLAAEDIRFNAEARHIKLIAETLSPCLVMADEGRIKQVIWNLLTNAMKFADGGTIEVSVTADSTHAELTVRDTGIGIPAEALERIFDRFQQAQNGQAARVAGLGLGLWLVKNLVALHGGTVSAHSDGLGQGATFRVRLPRFR